MQAITTKLDDSENAARRSRSLLKGFLATEKKPEFLDYGEVYELMQFNSLVEFKFTQMQWELLSAEQQLGVIKSFHYRHCPDHKPTRAVDVAHVQDDSVSSSGDLAMASIVNYLSSSSKRAQAICALLSENFADDDVDGLMGDLALIVSNMKILPGANRFGEIEDISALDYSAWKANYDKEVYPVGPYLMYKFLMRMGVAWKVWEDGMTYMSFTRAGTTISTFSKYIVDGFGDDPAVVREEARKFLAGLCVGNKQLRYVPIDYRIYLFFDYFNAHHKITTKDGLVHIAPLAHPPMSDRVLSDMFAGVLKHLNSGPIEAKEADVAIDRICQRLTSYFDGDMLVSVHEASVRLGNLLKRSFVTKVEILEEIARLPYGVRDEQFANAFGSKGTADEACANLKNARAIRNTDQVKQYLAKNVGSVVGTHLPQAVDTITKWTYVVEYLRTAGLAPPLDGNVVSYGVAYGHGSDVIRSLVPQGQVEFYDVKKAANSPAEFLEGNIYSVTAAGGVVLDDTDTHKKVKEAMANEYRLIKGEIGDHAKLRRLCADPPIVAVIKMGLGSFATSENKTKVTNLLFPGVGVRPFKSVRLMKFGKLHNQEVFLVLSNHESSSFTTVNMLASDVKAMSHIVTVANKVIMEAHNRGVRPFSPLVVDGGVVSVVGSEVWRALVSASTVKMPWYGTGKFTKDSPLSGGSVMAGAMLQEGEMDNMVMEYADEHVVVKEIKLPLQMPPASVLANMVPISVATGRPMSTTLIDIPVITAQPIKGGKTDVKKGAVAPAAPKSRPPKAVTMKAKPIDWGKSTPRKP